MKRINRYLLTGILLLSLLLSPISSSPVQAAGEPTYLVSGITYPSAANGIYTYQGYTTIGGVITYSFRYWMHTSGNYYIYKDEFGSGNNYFSWNIDNNLDDETNPSVYFYVDDTSADNFPPASGYLPDNSGFNATGNPVLTEAKVITVNDVSANENTNSITFTISLSATNSSNITLNYATADNTATIADNDYTNSSGTATITAGSLSTTVTVPITGDTKYETDDSFYINLTNASSGYISDAQGIGTITNDDNQPSVTLELTGSPLVENGGLAVLTATLSNRSYQNITINLGYSGTATGGGTDYTGANSIIVPSNSLSSSTNLTGVNDALYEGDETIIVDISSVTNGTENGTQQVTATITDDEAPEINITGNSTSIMDGDITPDAADYTDFGNADISTGQVVRTFTIENTNVAPLLLTGASPYVVITGATTDFDLTQTPSNSISGGSSTIFEVTFNPTAIGTRSASISIANNDDNEDPYTFSIQGNGISSSEMDVSGLATSIADGDLVPSILDGTDFGNVNITTGSVEHTFTITNSGSASLTLTDASPYITISGADFSLSQLPSNSIATGGGTTTFRITFNPTTAGTKSATISIANDDNNENPYNFNIQGVGITTPSVTTSVVTTVTPSGATLGGNITTDGGASVTERGVVYSSTNSIPTIGGSGVSQNTNGSGMGIFTESIGLMTSATYYYYRAYAINSEGTSYGDVEEYTTQNQVTSITRSQTDPNTNASSVTWYIVFDANASGLSASNFTLVTTGLASPSITGVSGGGSSWSVTANTGTGSGTLGLNLTSDTGLNAGLSNIPYTGETFAVDRTPPTTTILSNPSNPTNSASANFTYSGDDGIGVGGITFECKLETESFTPCTGSRNYANLTDGSHTFQVRATDSLGNMEAIPASYTWTVDTNAPTVFSITSTANDPTKFSPIPVTITFSEPVCGFHPLSGDLNLTNATTSDLTSGSDGSTVYTFNLTPVGQGQLSVFLISGSIYDGDCVTPMNYNSTSSATFSITYDTVAPTVTINQASVGQSDPTSLSPVNFTATFNEAVTSFSGSNVDLSASTAPGTLSATITGGPAVYNVAVSGMTGDGTVIASIPVNSITDLALNLNSASSSTDNVVNYIYAAPPVIAEGTSVTVTMSENGSPMPFALTLHATDANSDPLTWSILSPAGTGTADVGASTGVVSYTSPLNTTGTDSFVAQVSDGNGGTDSITVNVSIQAPSAVHIINSAADTGDGQVDENEHTSASITQLLVIFNNSMDNTAQVIANYTLFRDNTIPVTINTATYDNSSQTTTLGVAALSEGKYTLTVKGTIQDSFGYAIGVDFSRIFYIDNTGIQVIASGVTLPNNTVIVDGATVNTALSEIWVTFDEDAANPAGDTDTNDVTYPANYLLVRPGLNTTFDTLTCLAGPGGDDIVVPIGPVTYDNGGGSGPYVSKIRINNGTTLENGNYKFYICGTTSITDLAGNDLNGGSDYPLSFTVLLLNASSTIVNPSTGFEPGVFTSLALQPAEKAYTDLGNLWIDIPSMDVKTTITGVPLLPQGWDLTWLHSQVGWLNGTAYPTWNGNTVLTAHAYTSDGLPGPFALLKNLEYGDTFTIHFNSQAYTYIIRSKTLVSAGNTNLLTKHETDDWVTLITCQQFDEKSKSYLYRWVVRAVLTSVQLDQ